jgi:hypothetical protein
MYRERAQINKGPKNKSKKGINAEKKREIKIKL